MKCAECNNFTQDNYGSESQPLCKKCHNRITGTNLSRSSIINKWGVPFFIAFLIILLSFALFFGFFHIIPNAPGFPILPKEHFTYTMTFISIKDFVKLYNNRSFIESMHGNELLDNLNRQMMAKGWVSHQESAIDNLENNNKASRISEYGLIHALDSLVNSPSWQGPINKTECENGWYQATVSNNSLSQLLVIAEGHYGTSIKRIKCYLKLTLSGKDTVWVQQNLVKD
jgi:hypothetical protein